MTTVAPWAMHETTLWPEAVAVPLAPKRKGIKTSSAKAKGRELQKRVAALILATFPTLEPDDARSTSMGAGGEDVQLSPAARKLFPMTVECKKRAAHGVYAFYDQASAHKRGTVRYEPLVVIEADRRKPLALVDLEYFMKLAKISASVA